MVDHDVAVYCERALNNFPLKGRRLIIDFALEDQRKLLKREKKRESFLNQKVKKESKKKQKKKNEENENISEINNVKKLKGMLRKCKSRGKKQRIKKRLIALGEIKPPQVETKELIEESAEEPIIKLAGKRRPKRNKEIEDEIMKLRKQDKQKKRTERKQAESKFDVCVILKSIGIGRRLHWEDIKEARRRRLNTYTLSILIYLY